MNISDLPWREIALGLTGLGVFLKGMMDRAATSKGVTRGCLYDGAASEDIRLQLEEIIKILQAHSAQSTETHDYALVIKTILEGKK